MLERFAVQVPATARRAHGLVAASANAAHQVVRLVAGEAAARQQSRAVVDEQLRLALFGPDTNEEEETVELRGRELRKLRAAAADFQAKQQHISLQSVEALQMASDCGHEQQSTLQR